MSAPEWLSTYLADHTVLQVSVHAGLAAGGLLLALFFVVYPRRHRQ